MTLSTLLTPMLAFAGALLGVALSLRSARDLERRSVREETMRNVRWASELAVAPERRAELGVAQLRALDSSAKLETFEQAMINAALTTMEPGAEEAEEETP